MGFLGKKAVPEGYPQGFGIEWLSKRSFRLEGHEFTTFETTNDFFSEDIEQDDKFFMAKNSVLIHQCMSVVRECKPKSIVELGINRGGSAAFLHLIAKPKKMLALELSSERIEKLDRFIQAEKLQGSMRAEYGVDQSDTKRVRELTAEHIGPGRCVDVVFDDASHILAPTRSSFETLFPYIRQGGSYIVEDYSAAQTAAAKLIPEAVAGSEPAARMFKSIMSTTLLDDHQPCHLLAVEAILASMVDQGIIQRVIANKQWLRIVRGPKEIENPGEFDLRALASDHWGILGSAPDDDTLRVLSS